MNICILFDLKEDYELDNIEFGDFTVLEEAMVLANTLTEAGHKVQLLHGIDMLLINTNFLKESFDLVINLIEGPTSRNREALIPAFLELYNIPYIGSDCYASSICLDKYLTKIIAQKNGILTPNFTLYIKHNKKILGNLPSNGKLILKPVHGGSSDGIILIDANDPNLHNFLTKLGNTYKQNILIEEYISGGDYSVSVMGNTSSGYSIIGAVRISDKSLNDLLVYDKLHKQDDYNVIKTIPDWSESTRQSVYSSCLRMAEIIELSGFFRFDFRIYDQKPFFLEINTIPSLTVDGSFIKCLDLNGLDRKEIFTRILKNENFKFK